MKTGGSKFPSLTKISDFSADQIEAVLSRAYEFREKKLMGVRQEPILAGRVVSMIFEKASLRTKVAFEVAAYYLGGFASFLSSSQIMASGGNEQGRESVPDIARNLERFSDLIAARVYKHEVIEQMSNSVACPVINLLCDRHHPTQALADIMTLRLCFPNPERKLKVAFIGDGNNVATSLMQACALLGIDFSIASPKGYELPKEEVEVAVAMSKKSGAKVILSNDPEVAAEGSDCVYADTFVSMGQEKERRDRLSAFANFQINSRLMSLARPTSIFLHCLPAYRGEEVTADVMDSAWSRVFDQAECRLHIAKSLLALMLGA